MRRVVPSRRQGNSIRLWPVSYTHLDVYKRQSVDSAINVGTQVSLLLPLFDAGVEMGADLDSERMHEESK